MDDEAEQSRASIYTIGHSNHTMETFIDLLQTHGIEVLVDVRSQPYSRFSPHFSRQSLEYAVKAAGIRYVFMGQELGGRPKSSEFYDEIGKPDYAKMRGSASFKDGIRRLECGADIYRVAVMCSEENPTKCHRRLLIGAALLELGIQSLDIRRDGRIECESIGHNAQTR